MEETVGGFTVDGDNFIANCERSGKCSRSFSTDSSYEDSRVVLEMEKTLENDEKCTTKRSKTSKSAPEKAKSVENSNKLLSTKQTSFTFPNCL